MGDVFNKVGSFIGDVTGYNAQQRANSAAGAAGNKLSEAARMNEATGADISKQLGENSGYAQSYDKATAESLGANAGDTLSKATDAASKQALNAANLSGGQAAAGARAAGLNPGQAAIVASQGTNQAYQNQLNQGVNQYGTFADLMAATANAKRNLTNENINQGLQRAGNEASIATGSTGLANQQQQTANQQGGTALSGATQVLGNLFQSDENSKTDIKDLSGGIDTGNYGYSVPKFGSGGGGKGGGIVDQITSMMGGGGGAAGASGGAEASQALPAALAAMSDQNQKTDVAPASMADVLSSMLANVKPVSFKYRPGIEGEQSGKPDGTDRVGILAQDLEKTPLKDTVVDTPQGKKLDVPQLSANNTALILELARQLVAHDDRIKQLEGGSTPEVNNA